MVFQQLIRDQVALLVIDLQQDFLAEGPVSVCAAADIIPKAKQVLAAARHWQIPIIHTQEVHRKEMVDFGRELDGAEPVHCLENWPGTHFHPDFLPQDGEFVITKRRYSAFFATDLEILLKGLKVETLILMGALTNVCVHYTAVDAHQQDYRFYVIEDGCIGSDWEAHTSALKAMSYLQRHARITASEFIAGVEQYTQPIHS